MKYKEIEKIIKENVTAEGEVEKRALDLVIDFWKRLDKGVSEDYWKLVILESVEIEYMDDLRECMWASKDITRERKKILEAIQFLQGYLRQRKGDIV